MWLWPRLIVPQEAPPHDAFSDRYVHRCSIVVSLLQADQTVEDDPFADLRDYSDQETADTIADEAGPSSLPHKENLRPAPERISGHTRAQQPRRDLVDTRTIAVPSLKGLYGKAGSDFEGRLQSAAPKEGTQPEAFYGLQSGGKPAAAA